MAWTETTRARYERHSGRYASDLTDQEWGLIAPFLPPPKTTGRPRSTALHRSPETRSCAFFFIAPFLVLSVSEPVAERLNGNRELPGATSAKNHPEFLQKSAQRLSCSKCSISSGR